MHVGSAPRPSTTRSSTRPSTGGPAPATSTRVATASAEVRALNLRRLSNGVSNFYLLEEGGRITVVDAGTPRDWRRLSLALSQDGRRLSDIECVLLTHAHSDHTGFAERARTECGATVRVHAADEAVARGGKIPARDGNMLGYLVRPEMYRTLIRLAFDGAMRIVPVAEMLTYADGEVLDVPGRPRVLHTPGHTPGSASLLLEARGVLFTGDTLVTRNPLTGRRGPQIMPSGFNQDSQQAMDSLGVLAGCGAALLVLPGHGEPIQGTPIAEVVAAARAAGRS